MHLLVRWAKVGQLARRARESTDAVADCLEETRTCTYVRSMSVRLIFGRPLSWEHRNILKPSSFVLMRGSSRKQLALHSKARLGYIYCMNEKRTRVYIMCPKNSKIQIGVPKGLSTSTNQRKTRVRSARQPLKGGGKILRRAAQEERKDRFT